MEWMPLYIVKWTHKRLKSLFYTTYCVRKEEKYMSCFFCQKEEKNKQSKNEAFSYRGQVGME